MAGRTWLGIAPPEVPSLDWIAISLALAGTALAVLRTVPTGL